MDGAFGYLHIYSRSGKILHRWDGLLRLRRFGGSVIVVFGLIWAGAAAADGPEETS
jgi:hypothetical protein